MTRTAGRTEREIQDLYARLNDEVYALYGIRKGTCIEIEESLGNRPNEVLWPQMERHGQEQKRVEHVWRLLSFIVKRVVEVDEDGIVHLVADPGKMLVLVNGGLGNLHALALHTFGPTVAVTRPF